MPNKKTGDIGTGKTELDRLEKEMEELKKHIFNHKSFPNVDFRFNPLLAMLDGKTKNLLTEESSYTNCPTCGAKPTEVLRDLQHRFGVRNPKFLTYGISNLHWGPNAFKWLMKLASHQPFRRYHCTGFKDVQEKEMERMCMELALATGCRAFEVKQGCGTTNSGNIARRAFEDPKLFAEILRLPVDFVEVKI